MCISRAPSDCGAIWLFLLPRSVRVYDVVARNAHRIRPEGYSVASPVFAVFAFLASASRLFVSHVHITTRHQAIKTRRFNISPILSCHSTHSMAYDLWQRQRHRRRPRMMLFAGLLTAVVALVATIGCASGEHDFRFISYQGECTFSAVNASARKVYEFHEFWYR